MQLRAAAIAVLAVVTHAHAGPDARRLPVAEYRDKMKAGWVGQMVGVAWGAPTEFKVKGRIMDERILPEPIGPVTTIKPLCAFNEFSRRLRIW